MRWKAVIVLAALLFAVLAPHSIGMIVSQGHIMIGSLDFCHSASPALFSNGFTPFMNVTEFVVVPAFFVRSSTPFKPALSLFLFSKQTEQPPEA